MRWPGSQLPSTSVGPQVPECRSPRARGWGRRGADERDASRGLGSATSPCHGQDSLFPFTDTEDPCLLPFLSELQFTWAVTCLSSHHVLTCGPCAVRLKPHI